MRLKRIEKVSCGRGAWLKTSAITTVGISTLAVAAMASTPAKAQSPQPAQQTSQAPVVEEVVITGTRIVRDGYEAPTPLTVVTPEAIDAAAPENLADFVNKMPALVGSASPLTQGVGVSGGTGGINGLNLRNIGGGRTLVLVDGQRSVGASLAQIVDVSGIPQGLVSRVDIVTGGASAAYGSDAVSGVVNFILDKKYTGIKGEVSGGVTTYGDNRSWRVSITGGTPFGGDSRGHLLLSAEATRTDGIPTTPRGWKDPAWAVMQNPAYTATNGQPEYLLMPHVSLKTATPGGIITNTALAGITFERGGAPRMFNYGAIASATAMSGGDYQSARTDDLSLLPGGARQNFFARVSYDVTDNFRPYAQLSWSRVYSFYNSAKQFNIGNLTMKSDNAFLPASVAAQAAALKITQFTYGTNNEDLPRIFGENTRRVDRYVVGADGNFEAFAAAWNWDAYYQKGVTHSSERVGNVTANARYTLAIDAVRNPANGTIICRSTLANPTNGCVPYNVFGIGVNGQAAINYLEGAAYRYQHIQQDVIAGTVTGNPFESWAGPVSLATGVEWRKEQVRGIVDPTSTITGWFAGNFLPTFGSYTVTEGFVETVVPLARDVVCARSLDLNAAARFTSYSVSGFVTTWKVGLTYDLIDGVRFRGTRSRDIRAPNLSDLFNAGGSNTATVIDPFNNNLQTQYRGFVTGNVNLVPEKADTTGLGVVVQPEFFPGFTAAVDYYNIDISGAIGSLSAQGIVDRCFAGNQSFCPAIIRGIVNGVSQIDRIINTPFNFLSEIHRGIDFEAAYRLPLSAVTDDGAGEIQARLLATRFLKRFTNNGVDEPTETVGSNGAAGPPKWKYQATLTYTNDPLTLSFSANGLPGGTQDNSWRECTSGCPTSTATHRTININHVDGALYFDGTVSYKLDTGGGQTEVFFNIKNISDKAPPIVGPGPAGNWYTAPAANENLYDSIGRSFRAGVRFKM